jgi:hypothetical protein
MPVVLLEGEAGFSYVGNASLLAIPSPSAPPAGITRREMVGKSFVMPLNPALDQFGRPDPHTYIPSEEQDNTFGGLQVVVGGVDVTYYRSIPTQVGGWTLNEPFADAAATISFPQISPFEELPFWLDEYATVEIVCDADGTILFEGLAEEPGWDDRGGLTITCIGVLMQGELYVRAPGMSDSLLPISILIRDYAFNKTYRPGYRFPTIAIVNGTSVQSRYRGSWESPNAYADKLIKQASTDTESFTCEILRPRTPLFKLRDDTTAHYTLYYGAPGVDVKLRQHWRRGNVIYGTGQTSATGAEWRGVFLDPEWGGPRIQPLAYDPAVHGYDEVGDGTLSLDTARRDSELIRIEEFHSFGQGTSRNAAKGIADAYRQRLIDPGYTGTITLESDPCPGTISTGMSRFRMKHNQNILLRNFAGIDDGLLLHVAGVDVNWDSETVTLTVDSKARDRATIEALGLHKPEAYDPWRLTQEGKQTDVINDSVAPWDTDGGSGWFPGNIAHGFAYIDLDAYIPVVGSTWTTDFFFASERDTIFQTWVSIYTLAADAGTPDTSDPEGDYPLPGAAIPAAVRFGIYFFDRPPVVDDLPDDPLAEGAWENRVAPTGIVGGWGQQLTGKAPQAAGYEYGMESQGDPALGVLVDRGTWQYDHIDVPSETRQPAFLWLAVWIDAPNTQHFRLRGRIHRGIGS